ncbi:hypothetical protein [Candidatus Hecatella orcuttiae]|uniref:hypothetical protein n=1 Tax=Candidatus Hecatella orcuttiae TaxID=1935119 RepID=UPI002867E149|nr:hypothetical protein [Candidatus Hecatella orcuttiae]
MGEVFKPERLTRARKKPLLPDAPRVPSPPQPLTLTSLYQEILELKEELEKIKTALKRQGILLED